jgi:hypothetical protein
LAAAEAEEAETKAEIAVVKNEEAETVVVVEVPVEVPQDVEVKLEKPAKVEEHDIARKPVQFKDPSKVEKPVVAPESIIEVAVEQLRSAEVWDPGLGALAAELKPKLQAAKVEPIVFLKSIEIEEIAQDPIKESRSMRPNQILCTPHTTSQRPPRNLPAASQRFPEVSQRPPRNPPAASQRPRSGVYICVKV